MKHKTSPFGWYDPSVMESDAIMLTTLSEMQKIPLDIELTLPILKLMENGRSYSRSELRSIFKKRFQPQQVAQATPYGRPLIAKRLDWAVYYLRDAGLVTTLRRGVYHISSLGTKCLSSHPKTLTHDILGVFKSAKNTKQDLSRKTDIDSILETAKLLRSIRQSVKAGGRFR